MCYVFTECGSLPSRGENRTGMGDVASLRNVAQGAFFRIVVAVSAHSRMSFGTVSNAVVEVLTWMDEFGAGLHRHSWRVCICG